MKIIGKILSIFWAIFPHIILILVGTFLWWYLSYVNQSSTAIDSIAGGIISGLITASLLFVFAILWRKNIEPWVENLLYKDVCIEGEWTGILIPYLGLDDLDKVMRRAAWKRYQQRVRKERKEERGEPVPSSSVIEAGEEKEVSAELILHKENSNFQGAGAQDDSDKHIKISLSPIPIIVRVEIARIGHKITGRVIEIGGASKIHTYTISGSFKNLIFAGCYETCSRDNIDRGALSLMLKHNGKVFEGFFSSYSDSNNSIAPMQCVLKKKNSNSDAVNEI